MKWESAVFESSAARLDQLPQPELPEVAFSGRSNVGKSSLINRLCGRKNLARVSSTPGKTATINFYNLDTAWLVDLPGYGYAKVSAAERQRWDELINSYFDAGRRCALLLQLLDCRHAPSADDEQMMQYLQYHGIPFVAVLTKADKLKKSARAQTVEQFTKLCAGYGCQAVVLTSAENGEGIDQLRGLLEAALEEDNGGL